MCLAELIEVGPQVDFSRRLGTCEWIVINVTHAELSGKVSLMNGEMISTIKKMSTIEFIENCLGVQLMWYQKAFILMMELDRLKPQYFYMFY